MDRQVWVFIDVDGTLIDKDDQPRPHVVEFFRRLAAMPSVRIIVWSAGQAGSRGAPLGEYARQKIASIDYKLDSNIRLLVHDYMWKGSPLLLTTREFFIDDADGLLTEKARCGHGTFQVPFYEASVDEQQSDRWLLHAARAVEDFVWKEQDRELARERRVVRDGTEPATPAESVGESPRGPSPQAAAPCGSDGP